MGNASHVSDRLLGGNTHFIKNICLRAFCFGFPTANPRLFCLAKKAVRRDGPEFRALALGSFGVVEGVLVPSSDVPDFHSICSESCDYFYDIAKLSCDYFWFTEGISDGASRPLTSFRLCAHLSWSPQQVFAIDHFWWHEQTEAQASEPTRAHGRTDERRASDRTCERLRGRSDEVTLARTKGRAHERTGGRSEGWTRARTMERAGGQPTNGWMQRRM